MRVHGKERAMRVLGIMCVLACGVLCSAENSGAAAKDSKPPAAVGPEILKLLEGCITLAVKDMAPSTALAWQLRLTDIPLGIEATEKVEAKKVSFHLEDVTLAEALRKISEATGAQYRLTPKMIRLALPDEWKAIDAGTKRFEELKTKTAK